MPKETYRQYIPDLELSIERATSDVPNDGKYYVRHGRMILGAYKTLKQAREHFKRIVAETGYKPKVSAEKKTAAEEQIQRYMEAKDLYWAESHRYRGGGGRGGRGGV